MFVPSALLQIIAFCLKSTNICIPSFLLPQGVAGKSLGQNVFRDVILYSALISCLCVLDSGFCYGENFNSVASISSGNASSHATHAFMSAAKIV